MKTYLNIHSISSENTPAPANIISERLSKTWGIVKITLAATLFLSSTLSFAQNAAQGSKPGAEEEEYYKIITVPIPKDVELEVGGLATMPDGRLAVSTRKGDVWLIENPYMRDQGNPYFKRFAQGLHEP